MITYLAFSWFVVGCFVGYLVQRYRSNLEFKEVRQIYRETVDGVEKKYKQSIADLEKRYFQSIEDVKQLYEGVHRLEALD